MRIKIFVLLAGALLIYTNLAESGAAVAMQNKKKAGGGGPRQLPPGYVMGPNGIQKIPEAGENESPQQESAEQSENEQAVEVQDIVDLKQITEALQASGKPWELIISHQDKEVIVQEFIQSYADEGITIKKPAAYYANYIDEMSKGSPEMLDMPFKRILQVVAVMEYDFDNGENKDALAQKILGPQVYEKNRQRLMKNSTNPQQGH